MLTWPAFPAGKLIARRADGRQTLKKRRHVEFILEVNENLHTIVLIEHDMGVVTDISDRVIVLDYGVKQLNA